ncbi:MAG: nicotinamide mononucleotide transporter [Bacteroidetes bacterium]|nr:nicotinamide mononucleotide transporter [Bacteroidota bacterium]
MQRHCRVWLTAQKNIWCFPIGLINVIITTWLVYEAKLFADVLQQIMFACLLVIGWIKWHKQTSEVFIAKIKNATEVVLYVIMFIAIASALYVILVSYTQAAYPLWDSIGTALSFVAQWMIAKRKNRKLAYLDSCKCNLQHFVFMKELPLYSTLSIVYLLMAVVGYFNWKKILQKQNTNGLAWS